MKTVEAIRTFFQHHGQNHPDHHEFNVYRREEFACDATALQPDRRAFYKISLVKTGEGFFNYGGQNTYVDRPSITLLNPIIPYAWKPTTRNQSGYFCIFTDDFISRDMKKQSLAQSLLFQAGGSHILFPSGDQLSQLIIVFESMVREMQTTYAHKYHVLRNYVQILMHEVLKIQPTDNLQIPHNAAQRLYNLFNDLLEQQFPIESPNNILRLKNANEFATVLNVHTNHLNRSLKEATGKTTQELIARRVTMEARALLMSDKASVAEIAYRLGFEHATNFHLFFKKQTGQTPGQFRDVIASLS